jgi:hypothetical protein
MVPMRALVVWMALGMAACSAASGAKGTDGGAPPVAGNTLTGTYSFPVVGSTLDAEDIAEACGTETTLPGGGVLAFGIVLSSADSPTLCSAIASNSSAAAGQPAVVIQVASNAYIAQSAPADGGAPAPLTTGTYKIGFENVTDDDLCMLSGTGGQALVDVLQLGMPDAGGATPKATAVSGTVTVTAIASSHVVGSFDVQLAPVSASGSIDTQHPTAFSGTFDSTACAGMIGG